MEKLVLPVAKQMERFIPTEGITFFSVSPLRPEVLYQEPGFNTRAQNIACQNMAGSSDSYGNVIQVYTRETCCFSSTLLADFLAHNCKITGKSDGCF